MKIIMKENNVFEFELEPKDSKYITSSDSYEEAKKYFLSYIENALDKELQRLLIEFNKSFYSK